jgi:hypothetical protein
MGRESHRKDDVVDRRLTDDGLVLRLRSRPVALFPALLPARTQERIDAAIAALDEPAPADLLVAGRAPRPERQRLILAALIALIVAFGGVVFAIVSRRFASTDVGSDAVAAFIALLIPVLIVSATAFMPGWRRTFLARRTLVVGEETFDLSMVDAIGVGDAHLTVEQGGRACLAWVGPQEGALRDALGERLRALDRPVDDVLGPLPSWASRWRRRARFALRLTPAAFLPTVALAGALLAPNLQLYRYDDGHGQTLLVVRALDGDRPYGCALITSFAMPGERRVAVRARGPSPVSLGDDDPQLTIELAERSFVLVEEAGARSSRPGFPTGPPPTLVTSIAAYVHPGAPDGPTILEDLATGVADPLVLAAASGRASVRVHDIHDTANERLVCGVARGRVVFIVRAPFTSDWRISRDGVGWSTKTGTMKVWRTSTEEPWIGARLDGVGASFIPDPSLPTDLDAVLEVRHRVEVDGLTIDAALRAR